MAFKLCTVTAHCSHPVRKGKEGSKGEEHEAWGVKFKILGKGSEMRNHQWFLVKSLAFLKRSPAYWLVNLAKLESPGRRINRIASIRPVYGNVCGTFS